MQTRESCGEALDVSAVPLDAPDRRLRWLRVVGLLGFIAGAALLLTGCPGGNPPSNTSPPTISGTPGVFLTLTIGNGTWDGDPTSYAYSWQRCNSSGGNCTTISGVTTKTYVVSGSDVGSTFRGVVLATNANGSTSANSAATGVVPPAGSCPIAGATNTWTGGAGTSNWSTAANWSRNAVPSTTDFACLPIDTPGGTIAVPGTTVRRIVAYKSLTLAATVTASEGVDVELPVTWQNGSIQGPMIIGPSSTVTVTGPVDVAQQLTNTGTIRIPDNGGLSVCGLWWNGGRLELTGNTFSAAGTCSAGRFVNAREGTVIKTGNAPTSTLNGSGQFENDGTITSQKGVLQLSNSGTPPTQTFPGDNISTGSFSGTGTGEVRFMGTGVQNMSPQVVFGNNVVDTGNLKGDITIPTGVTFSVGKTGETGGQGAGKLAGNVGGGGTLRAMSSGEITTLTGDLNVAFVQLQSNVTLEAKADGSSTVIGSGTTVSVTGYASLGNATTVRNTGTVRLLDQGSVQAGACNATWINAGWLEFAEPTSASFQMVCQSAAVGPRFINTSAGTVVKSGTAPESNLWVSGQLENDGTVTSLTNTLRMWKMDGLAPASFAPGDNVSNGSFSGTGSGEVDLEGPHKLNTQTTLANNVYVLGTITGNITIPAGVTFNVGKPNLTGGRGAGNVIGNVGGAGTLRVSSFPQTSTLTGDLNVATVQLQSYTTLDRKANGTPTVIGPSTTVLVSGGVTQGDAITVSNTGTVRMLENGLVNADCDATWLNSGRLEFAETSFAVFGMVCDSRVVGPRFINRPGGVVVKTGAAPISNFYASGQLENDGAINSLNGRLEVRKFDGLAPSSFAPGDNVSNGSFAGSATGTLVLTDPYAVNTQTIFGNKVYVLGTMTGNITIPAGVTLNIGKAGETGGFGPGKLTGNVNGAGTLRVETTGAPSVLTGDLNVANVDLQSGVMIARKANNGATVIGPTTTVTLFATPQLADSLVLDNQGTIDFGTRDYFYCETCSVINHGSFKLYNPDGTFLHAFNIQVGTFDNLGLIRMTGLLPGTTIAFWPGANVVHKGKAVSEGLTHPQWIQDLQSNQTVIAASDALRLTWWATLIRNAGLAAAANFGNIGAASCANINLNFPALGASGGACVVVDPDGDQSVVFTLTANIGASVSWPSSGGWNGEIIPGVSWGFDVGGMILWRNTPDGRSFNLPDDNSPSSDTDGPFICETGSVSFKVGATGQHCWGPADGVPYEMNTFPITNTGVHTAYLGATLGYGASVSFGVSYSVAISCGRWYTITLHRCPGANVGPPTISGNPVAGNTLHVSNGQWTLAGTLNYTYQWQRCDANGTNCGTISGATTNNYMVTTADKTKKIKAIVTGSNEGGSVDATSALVGPVP